jgi:hypothetical protein
MKIDKDASLAHHGISYILKIVQTPRLLEAMLHHIRFLIVKLCLKGYHLKDSPFS